VLEVALEEFNPDVSSAILAVVPPLVGFAAPAAKHGPANTTARQRPAKIGILRGMMIPPLGLRGLLFT
jgi:hypothetical protein